MKGYTSPETFYRIAIYTLHDNYTCSPFPKHIIVLLKKPIENNVLATYNIEYEGLNTSMFIVTVSSNDSTQLYIIPCIRIVYIAIVSIILCFENKNISSQNDHLPRHAQWER